jgi:hypothetical protein
MSDKNTVLQAIETIADLLPKWVEFEQRLPGIKSNMDRIEGDLVLADSARKEPWAKSIAKLEGNREDFYREKEKLEKRNAHVAKLVAGGNPHRARMQSPRTVLHR